MWFILTTFHSTIKAPKFNMKSYLVFLLIISLSLMNNCNALGGRKILEKDYTTFDVHSFLSASCKASVQVRSRPASLKVTRRYGHCSKSSLNESHIEPSLAEILAHDEIRVASIQNKRRAFNTKSNIDDLGVSKASISAHVGSIIGFSNYVVTIGLGTPAKSLTLAFDTGSSLTWTQCQPCAGYCYKEQKDPIFDPSASTSYSNASCDSAQCSQLSSVPFYQISCSQESTCLYNLHYTDGGVTMGDLANERLTLTPNDVFDNFSFGCGEYNNGTFGDTAGYLGLGSDYFSVVSQTAGKYGKYFSYCLPTQSGSNGHLTFGNDNAAPGNLVFTPLGNDPQGEFYIVNIIAISVGGTQLPISPSVFQSGGNIIDSGTTITRLPPTAYTALRDAFKQQMSQYTLAPAFSIFDTCYDLGNQTSIIFPNISFMFEGNVQVDLVPEGVLLPVPVGRPTLCLAFAANKADTDTVVFGNVQQQTFDVVYDVAGGRLGFGPGGCS